MLLLKRAQDVLQQQGDSGGQGPESLRHLGEERRASVSGGRERGSFGCREGRGQQVKPQERTKRKENRVGEKWLEVR